jgi:adenylate kinase family enzyme
VSDPIWFVFGLSGAGKSHFCEQLRARRNWVHLDIDHYRADAIDFHHLRSEWNAFYHNSHSNPKPLIKELRQRCQQAAADGIVLSFPSNLIKYIKAEHIKACGSEVKFIFFSGAPEFCIKAFLAREVESGRRLNKGHWYDNNETLYCALASIHLRQRTIDTFTGDGERKSFESLRIEIERL